MVAKIVVFALCVVAVLGAPQAAQYPAGVDPHACPNYPYCDNAALAAHATGAVHSSYAAPTYAAYGHQAGVQGAAAQYPAGVNPHVCPNYPYCDNAALAAHATGAVHASYAAPAYASYGHQAGVHGAAAQYPAGVDPHTCPNYPYCH